MLASFIKLMRTSQGITQDEVVAGIGIKKASLSAYELGRFKLLPKNVSAICEKLGIDSDYVCGRAQYPFNNQNRLYKMRLSCSRLSSGGFSLEPLCLLLNFNRNIDVLIMTGDTLYAGNKHKLLSASVVAIALRDPVGNIFLLRQDDEKLVLFSSDIKNIIVEQIENSKEKIKTVRAASLEIGFDFRTEIERWTVEKKDIAILFEKVDLAPLLKITKEEAESLMLRRSLGIPIDVLRDFINGYKAASQIS